MNRKETLDAAATCVLKDRQATHGKPEDSFGLIARLWSAYLGVTIEPHTVAIMMGLLKVARLKQNPNNDDSYTDLAGYAACAAELAPSPPPSFWDQKLAPSQREQAEAIMKVNSPSPLPATVLEFPETEPSPTC